MIDIYHQAWPDLDRESEAIRLVDHRLNEALGAVAIKHPERITPREKEALKAVGQYDTQRIAGEHVDMTVKVVAAHLRGVRIRLPEDNKYVRLFNASTPSLIYTSWHEGLVDYELDKDWSGYLTRDQAMALKITALNTQPKDLSVLKHRTGLTWWTRDIQNTLGAQLGVPSASSSPKTGLSRIVGRAFEVGLFIPKKTELSEPD